MKDSFTDESALLENPPGGTMFGMAERIQPPDADATRQFDHGLKRFGRVTVSPRVFGECIPGHRAIMRFKGQPGRSQQRAGLTRPHEIWTRRPVVPFCVAEPEEPARIGRRLMTGPAEKARDVGVARVSGKHRFDVSTYRAAKHQPGCLESLGGLHEPLPDLGDVENESGKDRIAADGGVFQGLELLTGTVDVDMLLIRIDEPSELYAVGDVFGHFFV